jgi:hypothetical protein
MPHFAVLQEPSEEAWMGRHHRNPPTTEGIHHRRTTWAFPNDDPGGSGRKEGRGAGLVEGGVDRLMWPSGGRGSGGKGGRANWPEL